MIGVCGGDVKNGVRVGGGGGGGGSRIHLTFCILALMLQNDEIRKESRRENVHWRNPSSSVYPHSWGRESLQSLFRLLKVPNRRGSLPTFTL